MKASTHSSGVGVDIAAVERDCATVDEDATSRLPYNKSTSVKQAPQRGDGTGLGGVFGGVCVLRPEDREGVARNERKGHFIGAMK